MQLATQKNSTKNKIGTENECSRSTPDYIAIAEDKLVSKLSVPEFWTVKTNQIISNKSNRLDAEHYNPQITENISIINSSPYKTAILSDLAEIYIPNIFIRIWAADSYHGVQYINSTDLMCYYATGSVSQLRFLSYESGTDIDNLLLSQDVIIMTCSGTIGRVFDLPLSMNGFVGTHDLMRIKVRNPEIRGYIRSFLSTPLAQTQILSHTHGGQIDHVTADQIGSCIVPLLPDATMVEISTLSEQARRLKEQSQDYSAQAELIIQRAFKNA